MTIMVIILQRIILLVKQGKVKDKWCIKVYYYYYYKHCRNLKGVGLDLKEVNFVIQTTSQTCLFFQTSGFVPWEFSLLLIQQYPKDEIVQT